MRLFPIGYISCFVVIVVCCVDLLGTSANVVPYKLVERFEFLLILIVESCETGSS